MHNWLVLDLKCNSPTESGFLFVSDQDDIEWEVYVKDSKQRMYVVNLPEIAFGKGDVKNNIRLVDIEGIIREGNGHATEFVVATIERDRVRLDGFSSSLQRWLASRNVPPAGSMSSNLAAVIKGAVGPSNSKESETKNWLIEVAKEVAKVLGGAILNNSDEVPGVVFVRIENRSGSLHAAFSPLTNADIRSSGNNEGTFKFTGDSDYDATFAIRQLP